MQPNKWHLVRKAATSSRSTLPLDFDVLLIGDYCGRTLRLLKRMLRWCETKRNDGITFHRRHLYNKHELSPQEFSSDTAFGDHIDSGKSKGGVVGRLDGNACHPFTSSKSSHVALSTTHVKYIFRSKASRQINYEQQMCIDLKFELPKVRLVMVNRPNIIDACTDAVCRVSQRQKH